MGDTELGSARLERWKTRGVVILSLVGIIWVVEVINLSLGHGLCAFGIRPRSLIGLIGVPISPFLHGSLQHTVSNTIPLLILGWLVLDSGVNVFLELSLFIILFEGCAVWLFGRSSIHVGSSGLVFGYFGFLLARGWYERSLRSIVIVVVTLLLYGGLIWRVFPTQSHVSWEGHLFGLVAGILASYLEFAKVPRQLDDTEETGRPERTPTVDVPDVDRLLADLKSRNRP